MEKGKNFIHQLQNLLNYLTIQVLVLFENLVMEVIKGWRRQGDLCTVRTDRGRGTFLLTELRRPHTASAVHLKHEALRGQG